MSIPSLLTLHHFQFHEQRKDVAKGAEHLPRHCVPNYKWRKVLVRICVSVDGLSRRNEHHTSLENGRASRNPRFTKFFIIVRLSRRLIPTAIKFFMSMLLRKSQSPTFTSHGYRSRYRHAWTHMGIWSCRHRWSDVNRSAIPTPLTERLLPNRPEARADSVRASQTRHT